MTNHHCCVPGCGADSRKDTNSDKYKFLRGVTFHAFPRGAVLRNLWLALIKREDFDPSRYARICSLHFVGKRGPTETHPCPTLFNYNDFTGQVSEDLSARIEAVRKSKRGMSSFMPVKVKEEPAATAPSPTVKPVSTPLPKNLPPNMKVVKLTGQPGSTIMLDGKQIMIPQLPSGAQVKIIKAGGSGAGTSGNPYQFINENTDMLCEMGALGGDVQTTAKAHAQNEVAGTGTWKLERDDDYKQNESQKRKREESEEESDGEESEGSSSEEEDEEEEEEEEEGNDFEEAEAQTQIKKSKKETNGRAVVIQDGVQVPASVMDQINRPPLEFETAEVTKFRERLILRGPHANFMPKARCKYCDLFFANIHTLLDHIYRHTDRPYQCVECGEMFQKSQEMEDHIECHKTREVELENLYRVGGVKGGYLCCPLVGCEWSLRTEHIREFALHMRRHDPGNCVLCGEGLHGASETYFTKHLKKHVGFITRLRCPLCPEVSRQGLVHKNQMKMHLQETHKADKTWSCYHCEDEKPIKSFAELDLHLLKSHSSNPYECQYCGAAYPSLFGLRSHARKHHKRGKEHDDKYQWIAVIRSRQNKGQTLSSARKSKARKEVTMMPQMGDRLYPPMTPQVVNLLQKQSKDQKTVSMPIPQVAADNLLAALEKGKISVPTELTGSAAVQMMNLIQSQTGGEPLQKQMPKLLPKPMQIALPPQAQTPPLKMRPPSAKMLAASAKRQEARKKMQAGSQIKAAAAAAAAAAIAEPTPAPSPKATPPPPKQPRLIEKKYKPQKVFIPQKDGTLVSKTLLLPVEEPEDENELMAGIPIEAAQAELAQSKTLASDGGMAQLMALSSVHPSPQKMEQSHEGKEPATLSSEGPSGISLDNSVLESLGISSQDLELGPVTETDESLGFTITEVRGDIDFGALPDDSAAGKETDTSGQAPSLQEDKDDHAVMKITCPYKDCLDEFDSAVGFWRRHYLKCHFKRSDMYEYMCRDCGKLIYSWDWPPEDHDCPNPRWACICADCGDIFENMKNKNAHYPDCLTFQKYAPPPGSRSATTVITAHTCLYCTSGQKSVADLCSHLRVSHVSRRFNSLIIHCSLCSHYPTFPQAEKLWEHYKNSHREWWMKQPSWLCTKCGESLESEYELTKHVVYTHAENVKPSFLCNKCPFVFATSMLYNMHKEVAHKSGK